MFSAEQRERYGRNILVPSIGEQGQLRLMQSRVAVVGLGGLGSPVCYYLVAAGVGTIGLIDSDRVELSNLQRQILHTCDRIGSTKVASAIEALHALNPEVRFQRYEQRVTHENAARIFQDYDVIAEATDNVESKFLVNDVCLRLGKPFVTAGILGMSGHAMFVVPGKTPCLRCLFQEMPQGTPSTADEGVLGAVPGVLGSVQAMEIIRWLVGLWHPLPRLEGHLHGVDGVTMTLRTLTVSRRADCACVQCKVTK